MPLHDFECNYCDLIFEELHGNEEIVSCPHCKNIAQKLISKLADYTGQASRTIQYVTRKTAKDKQDSHLTKLSTDTTFLKNSIRSEGT